MKFYTREVAEQIVAGLKLDGPISDEAHLKLIAEERRALLGTGIKVITFLFTLIIIIRLAVIEGDAAHSVNGSNQGLEAAPNGIPFLGLEIYNPDLFAFSALFVGNVAYVVCTGLFMKVFVYEFMLLALIEDDRFKDDKKFYALMRSFHANMFAYLNIFGFLNNKANHFKFFYNFINFYSKYYVLIAYGLFYYYTLVSFILSEINENDYIYPAILVFINFMTILTSLAIFMPVKGRISAGENKSI